MYCSYCGRRIKDDSLFCSYCGRNLSESASRSSWKIVITKNDVKQWFNSSFFKLYALWCFIQCILWYKAQSAYSDYFNNERLDSFHQHYCSDNFIYPEDWFYPIRNLISGIVGQDPVYVYDGTEFFVYVAVIPILLTAIVQNSKKWFGLRTEAAVLRMRMIVWNGALWMCVLFPAGLFGIDSLGFTFVIGAFFFTFHSYSKLKTIK